MLKTAQPGNRQNAQTAEPPSTVLLRPDHHRLPATNRLPAMQSACGNQGMLRLIDSRVLQRNLTINQPGDAYEREADRVADAVMRMPDLSAISQPISQAGQTSVAQRACSCGGKGQAGDECEECNAKATGLQRSAAGSLHPETAPPIVHDVLRSPGQPLDTGTRNFMEARFGWEFGGVRIHTDRKAGDSTRAVNARAYTVGNHIVFGLGQYTGSGRRDRHLLAHELSHVVQQRDNHDHLHRACGRDEIEKKLPKECPIVGGRVRGGRRFRFNVGCDTFAPGEETRLRKFLKGISSTSEIQIFGMASSDGDPVFNDELACARTRAALEVIHEEHLDRSVSLSGGTGGVPDTSGNAEFRSVTIITMKGGPAVPSLEPELKNVDLFVGSPPNVIRQEPEDPELKGKAIQVTLDNYVAALGSADIVGGGACEKFTLGFFQICRPFDTRRVIWRHKELGTEFENDSSNDERRGKPALDVENSGDVWSVKNSVNCGAPGVLRTTDVLFTDKPSVGFLLKPTPNLVIKDIAWQSFFFNAFSVQRPDGRIRHLKSFYWSVHYCESFEPPIGSNVLGKSVMKKAKVRIERVIDGAPSEPGLTLAGKPATITCNQIGRRAKGSINTGRFDITGSCQF